ncbi:Aldehyde dehydrogenase (pyrroloquinoline-quinone)., Gluconate 2-dehydrogenase (acceptor) [Serratia sp. AS12]|uniref:molybdopterin cofactor-binding domain-containing protein n=1 Tax=Serratia TaxID=613 RepID=UPI00020E9ACA|nr:MULTISPECIES: molybdopterin cofactor-binding domain-containing protein [Serratia]AEF45398.1 Aldehyde dehydrogenase (pyrroloquinoline-quinone)., Gluconate 2-dehydrogenase (acceptor) [Serratia plymuthica AS9]AEF50349.1 Aldehyde dehydrogenase (pyrroloquinoline-quinone)., Gluconate 2-dehydrogenase (acceptor) [Serratia sp. AS12]AEG28056.1 Aldehyde dehydrogenase (pyrroloquinoline-quinone)., Gluconate 2-dehydrogenase (acceptor) [Serratia sp. AS13]UTN98865.1 molybdopterin-dependent oxidoreductase [S
MSDARFSLPSQAELLQRNGTLLVIDQIQPPPGLVPKGQTPTLKPKEQGLFIAICDSGEVYAFNGHVDLGTGVRTALGQIVAEELYLRMEQVCMVLGDTESTPNQGATIASATLQISAVPLRNAAAEARRWLLQQAAQRFNRTVDQLTLRDGAIVDPQGQTLTYGELVAGVHVELPISGDAPLKPQAEYRLVGTSTARVDIPAKATGETTYVHDMRLPNMLHGRVVRPPYAGYDSGEFVGTSLLAVDEQSIAAIPGIVKLVVIGDFIGIVAEREEQAIKAAQALQVSWKDWRRNLPQMTDVAQALRDNPHSTRVVHDTGNVDAALASADRRFTRTYLWPYQLHASIGPSCALADYQPQQLRVWSGTQNPHLLRADLAWLLEYPEAQIDIIRMEAAGCYGRNCADDVCADAALLSRAVGRPVRVQLTREQEHLWEPKGTAQLMEVDGGLDVAGHPVAYDFRTYYPSNGAPTLALLLTGRVEPVPVAYEMGDRTSVPPYEYPALRVSIEDMAPIVRASWMRGVSALPNTFAHESYIDELANAAGVDPLEYRLRYINDERATDLMRSTAERAGWTPHTEPMQTPAEDGVLRGRGFAYARYIHSKFPGFGAAWAAWVADVAIDKASGEVAVTRIVVGHDAGMMVNPDGVRHQIHGNVIQSTSRVLKERVTFEESTISSKEWGAYPILTFPEVPEVDVVMMPRPYDPPLGAGESASVPSAAAIANAVFDATGIRFRELPITSDRLREALNGPDSARQEPAPTAKPRRSKWWFGGAAGIVGALLGVAATALPWRTAIAPVATPGAGTWSAATLERGRQLAAVGDCAVCHTSSEGATNAGGLAMETPFGTLYSTNITPDVATGIGNWSFTAFDRAMRQGISRDGRHLYPAFPYTSFSKMTDGDMQALYAYMMSQPAVTQSNPANQMRFPFNLRPLMAGWNALFLRQGEYQPDPTQTAQWNRGSYLVNGLGHCAACHSPRNLMGAEKGGAGFLAGAMVDGWEAPALNQLANAEKPWSEEQLFRYLSSGHSAEHGVAAGPMGPVVSELATLPESDVRAMAGYLISLSTPTTLNVEPQVQLAGSLQSAQARQAGERLFQGACQACHSAASGGPQLFGVSLDLANNTNIFSDRPDNLIKVILQGIAKPATADLGFMPGFKDSFSDRQVADLVNYLRQRYAGQKPAWREVEAQVARLRANPGSH